MKAVMKPTYSPSHQPSQPPSVAPKNANRLLRSSSLHNDPVEIDRCRTIRYLPAIAHEVGHASLHGRPGTPPGRRASAGPSVWPDVASRRDVRPSWLPPCHEKEEVMVGRVTAEGRSPEGSAADHRPGGKTTAREDRAAQAGVGETPPAGSDDR